MAVSVLTLRRYDLKSSAEIYIAGPSSSATIFVINPASQDAALSVAAAGSKDCCPVAKPGRRCSTHFERRFADRISRHRRDVEGIRMASVSGLQKDHL